MPHALKDRMSVGVISDTHGLLRPEAVRALQGADLIIHAGDVGDHDVLAQLGDVAPVFAVRGNVDRGAWAASLPSTQSVEVGRFLFYVVHELPQLDVDPVGAGIAAVVFGHSHRPSVEFRDRVLYLNPGSAGRRRFSLPISIARVNASSAGLEARIVELHVA